MYVDKIDFLFDERYFFGIDCIKLKRMTRFSLNCWTFFYDFFFNIYVFALDLKVDKLCNKLDQKKHSKYGFRTFDAEHLMLQF